MTCLCEIWSLLGTAAVIRHLSHGHISEKSNPIANPKHGFTHAAYRNNIETYEWFVGQCKIIAFIEELAVIESAASVSMCIGCVIADGSNVPVSATHSSPVRALARFFQRLWFQFIDCLSHGTFRNMKPGITLGFVLSAILESGR